MSFTPDIRDEGKTASQHLAEQLLNSMMVTQHIDRPELMGIAESYLAKALTLWQDELVARLREESNEEN